MKPNVIVVGAGAAGLIAARELSKKNFTVTILEYRQETGGRIQTHGLPGGNGVVEGGAEFVHGKLPITLALCREAGIEYLPVEGKMYRKEKNKWTEESQMAEGWDELIEKMGSLQTDMTLTDFLAEYYSAETHTGLRTQISSYVQGFDLADPARVSVQALYEEWSHEDEDNFRFPKGYHTLIEYLENKCLENGCIIEKGDAVKQVDWQKDEVMAHTASGKKYTAEKIIITVPIGILTNIAGPAAINFTPAIDPQMRAARDIGFGTVIKVVILFKEILWKDDTRFIFSEEIIPTWWTQLPLSNNTLTGWVGGPKASKLSHYDDAELLGIALASLSNIFTIPTATLRSLIVQSWVFNWDRHDHALGAYSYPTPRTAEARKLLQSPLQQTLFFAGEGLYEGDYPGTVEAALSSGLAVAKRL